MRPSLDFIKTKFKDTPLIGAEIGVREGEHASIMLNGLKLEKLYLIDLWEDYFCDGKKYGYSYLYDVVKNKFKNNDNITIIKGDSVGTSFKFIGNSLDFIYIDANHQYEFVLEDIKSWYPKIKVGGYLCGHDYTPLCPGVIKAVNEFVKTYNLKLYTNDTDWWFKKEKEI